MANVAINVEVRSNGEVVLGKLGNALETVDKKAKGLKFTVQGFAKDVGGPIGYVADVAAKMATPMGMAVTAVGALGAAAVITGRAVAGLAAEAERLGNLSRTLGISADYLQRIGRTAENLGMSVDTATTAIARMEMDLGKNARALQAVGVDVDALRKMRPEQAFEALAAQIAATEDPFKRAGIASAAFGREWKELLPLLLKVGTEGTDAIVTMSDHQIQALSEVDDALDRLTGAWKDFLNQITAKAGTAGGGGALDILATGFRGLAQYIKETQFAGENLWQSSFIKDILSGTIGAKLVEAAGRAGLPTGTRKDWTKAEVFQTPGGINFEDPMKLWGEMVRDQVPIFKALTDEEKKRTEVAKELARIESLRMDKLIDEIAAMEYTLPNRDWSTGALSTLLPAPGPTFGGNWDFSKFDNELTKTNDKMVEVKATTVEWYDVLTSVAAQFNDLARIDGPIGAIAGMIGNIVTGVAGIGAGLNTFRTAGGGFSGLLGKISGIGGVIGGAIGIGSAIFSGIKSLFGGKSAQEKEAERQAKIAAEEARQRAAEEAARKRAAGLASAQTGIGTLIENLTYKDAAGKILSTFSDPKVAEAAAGLFGGTFWETFRTEGIAGIDKLRPAWEKLHEQLIKMGLDPVKLGLGRVGQLMDITKDPRTKALLGVSQGAGQLLRGAMDAGYVDLGFVKDSTTIARQTLQELQMQGLDSTTAAQAMADQLAALSQAYTITGQEMPEDLKLAMEAAGISVLPTQLEVLKESRDYLRQIAGATGHAEGAIVTRPHLAWVGEKGPEAIIPLRGRTGGSSAGVNLTIQRSLGVTRETEYAFDRRVEKTMRRLLRQNSAVRYDARVAVNGGR